jgi:hypothetical protein
MTRMQQSGPGVTNKRVDYAYNAVGQPINVKRFSDLAGTQPVAETTHTFDRLNRLSTINHSRGGVPLASYNYSFDANSRITSVTNKDGTSTILILTMPPTNSQEWTIPINRMRHIPTMPTATAPILAMSRVRTIACSAMVSSTTNMMTKVMSSSRPIFSQAKSRLTPGTIATD